MSKLLSLVDRSRLGSNQLPPVLKLGSAIVTNEAEAWPTDSVSDQALTRREAEVARLVSQGLANKVVAGQLGLCEGTVKIHLHTIYRKLRVSNRAGLILNAIANRR
jgi:DNA-binding NarL/FixJ family response regulator